MVFYNGGHVWNSFFYEAKKKMARLLCGVLLREVVQLLMWLWQTAVGDERELGPSLVVHHN